MSSDLSDGPLPTPTRLPSHARRAAVGAAALLLATTPLAGCSSDDSSDAGPCAATASSQTDGARSISVPNAEVTVTSPGADPTPLHVAPSTDSSQHVRLETSSVEASIAPSRSANGQQEVQKTQQQLATPITARTVCDDPRSLEFTIATPSTKDEQLSPMLDALDGSSGGVSFADGLSPTALRLKPTADSQSPARSALEQSLIGALDYSVALPTQPVGTGATWRTVRTVSAAATVTQTMNVTLVKRTASTVELKVDVEEVPVDSVFSIPGSGDKLHINRFTMAGDGTVTVDLHRMFPIDGGLTLRGARELVGNDPNAPILQQNEFTLAWKRSS